MGKFERQDVVVFATSAYIIWFARNKLRHKETQLNANSTALRTLHFSEKFLQISSPGRHVLAKAVLRLIYFTVDYEELLGIIEGFVAGYNLDRWIIIGTGECYAHLLTQTTIASDIVD
ncbi:hypothetical protein M9H77_11732 [Catharanthus roseus]|uniref:Uncharacterized protein n=1 Tax=Catharanthus roseus TaxID=4058 RepID=A0ACC0BFH7_CATRO|nr:hypothetical protein M9H77_11732 [Catharanthus roseus]